MTIGATHKSSMNSIVNQKKCTGPLDDLGRRLPCSCNISTNSSCSLVTSGKLSIVISFLDTRLQAALLGAIRHGRLRRGRHRFGEFGVRSGGFGFGRLMCLCISVCELGCFGSLLLLALSLLLLQNWVNQCWNRTRSARYSRLRSHAMPKPA